ncbi:MAG: hypothetical protein ACYTFQ_12310 [Planctomycetota bacterium]|jgi:hypothetical protein
MKNKQGRTWHLLFQRDGFRSKPMTRRDREQSRDMQLAERLAKLDVMHQPGDVIKLGKKTYGVMQNFAWKLLPTIPTT